jgi:hypothetical protein
LIYYVFSLTRLNVLQVICLTASLRPSPVQFPTLRLSPQPSVEPPLCSRPNVVLLAIFYLCVDGECTADLGGVHRFAWTCPGIPSLGSEFACKEVELVHPSSATRFYFSSSVFCCLLSLRLCLPLAFHTQSWVLLGLSWLNGSNIKVCIEFLKRNNY